MSDKDDAPRCSCPKSEHGSPVRTPSAFCAMHNPYVANPYPQEVTEFTGHSVEGVAFMMKTVHVRNPVRYAECLDQIEHWTAEARKALYGDT
jgi:hypothetical protein